MRKKVAHINKLAIILDQNFLLMKIRNKIDKKNFNKGFTESEIEILKAQSNLVFPKYYKEYLRVAGVKANMFDGNFFPNFSKNPLSDLINIQKHFLENLSQSDYKNYKKNDLTPWCFAFKLDEKEYQFFYINGKQNPIVYSFVNETFTDGWKEINGSVSKHLNFCEHINYLTEKKYGKTIVGSILSYLLLIIFSPFLILFFIYTSSWKLPKFWVNKNYR